MALLSFLCHQDQIRRKIQHPVQSEPLPDYVHASRTGDHFAQCSIPILVKVSFPDAGIGQQSAILAVNWSRKVYQSTHCAERGTKECGKFEK